MSIKAMNWAWSIKGLKPSEKLVLMKLADHSNDDGICWPGKEHIADSCEVSKRTADRIIEYLDRAKLLSVIRRASDTGRNQSNVYQLHLGQTSLFEGAESAGVQNLQGCKNEDLGVQKTHSEGAEFAPESSLEPKEEPSTSSSTAVEVLEYRSAKGKILKGPVLDRFERFWTAFDYKSGKAASADAWLTVERMYGSSKSLDWFHNLLAAARAEAKARSQDSSKVPKMAQGWLSERRFEDYRAQAGGPADAAEPKAWFETWLGVCEMAATRYGILDIEFGDPAGKMTELIKRMKERGDEIPAHLIDWHRSMTEAAA